MSKPWEVVQALSSPWFGSGCRRRVGRGIDPPLSTLIWLPQEDTDVLLRQMFFKQAFYPKGCVFVHVHLWFLTCYFPSDIAEQQKLVHSNASGSIFHLLWTHLLALGFSRSEQWSSRNFESSLLCVYDALCSISSWPVKQVKKELLTLFSWIISFFVLETHISNHVLPQSIIKSKAGTAAI